MPTYGSPARPPGFETDVDRGHVFTFSAGSGNAATVTALNGLRISNEFGSNLKIVSVRARVGTAPTGATLICDANLDGTTIYTTQGNRPTIAISGTASTNVAPDVSTWTPGQVLTVDVDQVGSTVTGAALTVIVTCTGA